MFETLKPASNWKNQLEAKCQRYKLDADATSLCVELLRYDLDKRATASQALSHVYFMNHPLPTRPELMPAYDDHHKWVSKHEAQVRNPGRVVGAL